MNRLKLFLENFLIYGLGSVLSKAVPLLMLPIITRLMPDTFYFGLNDMSSVVISFGSALAIMGMYDAMFRMFFDKEDKEYQKEICSSAFGFTIITSVFIFGIMIIFRKQFANLFFDSPKYMNLLFLSAISILIGSTNTIVSAPTRMNNQRKRFLIINTISPILSYSISIPLLINEMYLIAIPLAGVISACFTEIIFAFLNRKWFSFKSVKVKYIKQMLVIALPLVPNFLIYWIFNSSDRLMITKLIGADYTGIYAIGGKIGQISQLIYTAFAGGWQYFAFSTMKDNDQVELTSKIFEYLGIITFSCSIIMAAFSEIAFKIIFTGSYVEGAIVAPYLFAAPLLLMLFQISCNQFLIIKKTWPNMFILLGGALLNVLINAVLIPKIGIEGAAIGTLVGYVVSVVVCIIVLTKMKLIKISNKFLMCTLIVVIYGVSWRLIFKSSVLISGILAFCVIGIMIYFYRKELNFLFKKKS